MTDLELGNVRLRRSTERMPTRDEIVSLLREARPAVAYARDLLAEAGLVRADLLADIDDLLRWMPHIHANSDMEA